jgi:hypothetical protein
MSNIIAVPLNKLTRFARDVRKSGGESIDDLASSILVHGLIHLTVVEQLTGRTPVSTRWSRGPPLCGFATPRQTEEGSQDIRGSMSRH